MTEERSDGDRPQPRPTRRQHPVARGLWLVLGLGFVALGIIGALLPVMPTTIFLILAAGCFARSSTRLESWLLDHPRFGPTLRAWRANGAISRRGKTAASAAWRWAMPSSGSPPGRICQAALVVAVLLAGCAAFVLTRPTAGDGLFLRTG